MLVLSRRINESIVIGDNIEVSVIEVKGESVKLGITAPRSISVHRAEIYEAIRKANIEAAQTQVNDLNALDAVIRQNTDKKSIEKNRNNEYGDPKEV